jgi:branched-chain amino acid transport system permease protein
MNVLASGGFWAFVGVVAGIYTILALGLQVQFGFAGLLNFGQVGFMAIGAYAMAILVVKEGWSTWLAAPLGIAAAAAAGLLVGLPALRLRADYFAIVTIAFSEIVRYVATNETALTGGSQGTIALGSIGTATQYNGQWSRFQAHVQHALGLSSSDATMLVIVWAVAVVLLALTWLALRTPWGRVLRAIRDDEDAAASLGKNTFAYKLQALALGAALAGVAGLFYAWEFSFFSPDDFQPLLTFFAWMILLLGGLGRVWAVPVGALVFGFIFAGTRFLDFAPFTWFGSDERAYLRLIIIGLIIVLLVMLRPQGLLGNRREMVLE